MKVTIKTACGNLVTVNVDKSFQVWVDEDMLLEHAGPVAIPEDFRSCREGTYGSCHGTSSLFEGTKVTSDTQGTYIHFDVPNSSFISSIRWWSYEEALGENALEVNFKNGTYASYADVPEGVVLDWISQIKLGGSAGRYYNANIKNDYETIMEG